MNKVLLWCIFQQAFFSLKVFSAPDFKSADADNAYVNFRQFYNRTRHMEKRREAFLESWILIQNQDSSNAWKDIHGYKISFTPLADVPIKQYQLDYLIAINKASKSANNDDSDSTGEDGVISPFSRAEPASIDLRATPGCNTSVVHLGPCQSPVVPLVVDAIHCQSSRQSTDYIPMHWRPLKQCVEINSMFRIRPNTKSCMSTYDDKMLLHYVSQNKGYSWLPDVRCASNADGKCAEMKIKNCRGVRITGYRRITPGQEKELLHALNSKGPVIVWVNANETTFRLYSEGVYDLSSCERVNHPMLLIGYDQTPQGVPYWILKGSWGSNWGEHGYMRVRRKPSQCDLTTHAIYPIIEF